MKTFMMAHTSDCETGSRRASCFACSSSDSRFVVSVCTALLLAVLFLSLLLCKLVNVRVMLAALLLVLLARIIIMLFSRQEQGNTVSSVAG